MFVTVEFRNSQGVVEKRRLDHGSALDLLDRCDRQHFEVVAVRAPEGKVWSAEQARRQFGMAVGEDHRPH